MPHLKDRELKAGALSRTNWVRKGANDALHLLTSVEFLSRRVPATQRDTPSAKTVRRARKKSVVKKHHRQISPIVPAFSAARINTSVKHTWKLSSGVSSVVLQRAYVHRNLVSVVRSNTTATFLHSRRLTMNMQQMARYMSINALLLLSFSDCLDCRYLHLGSS